MTLQDEKTFFRQLGPNKPKWLTMTQWKALQRFYAYDNPDIRVVSNELATQLMGRKIQGKQQGYEAARGAIEKGRELIQNRIDLQDLDRSRQKTTSSFPSRPNQIPWWAGLD